MTLEFGPPDESHTGGKRVPLPALAKWLKAFRELRGESLPSVSKRLREGYVHERKGLEWFFNGTLGSVKHVAQKLRSLESGQLSEGRRLTEIIPLADAYGISHIMYGPLLSDVVYETLLSLGKKQFIKYAIRHDGEDVHYIFPEKRLAYTDDMLVWLDLHPLGCSDTHYHPGHELIFCISGTVEVTLHTNGSRTILKPKDFILFDSDAVHSARNPSHDVDAEIFIIRFYEFEGGGPVRQRHTDLAQLRQALSKRDINRVRRYFYNYIEPWIDQILTPIPEQYRMRGSDLPDEILDPVGLGRLLETVSLNDLKLRAKARNFRRKRDQLRKLRRGMRLSRPDLVNDILELAEILQMPPVLFGHYLFPTIPDFIVVQHNEDLRDIAPLFKDHLPPGVGYKVPCRNLADCDATICLLSLEPGSECPENQHPGFELALVLEGRIEIHLLESNQLVRISSEGRECAHYVSTERHKIINVGHSTAVVFVVRFYHFSKRSRREQKRLRAFAQAVETPDNAAKH